MSNIFPSTGFAPGVDNTGTAFTVTPKTGCEALYYSEFCSQKVQPKAHNALISELVSIINGGGLQYDCARADNVLLALRKLFAPPISTCAGVPLIYVGATTVSIQAGSVASSDGATTMTSSTNLAVNLASSGAGGLDAGSRAASTWYDVYVIGKADGSVAGIATLANGSPALPGGYVYQRFIGSVYSDATNSIKAFTQVGSEVYWTSQVNDFSASGAQVSASTAGVRLTVPPRRVKAIIRLVGTEDDAGFGFGITLIAPDIPGALSNIASGNASTVSGYNMAIDVGSLLQLTSTTGTVNVQYYGDQVIAVTHGFSYIC